MRRALWAGVLLTLATSSEGFYSLERWGGCCSAVKNEKLSDGPERENAGEPRSWRRLAREPRERSVKREGISKGNDHRRENSRRMAISAEALRYLRRAR